MTHFTKIALDAGGVLKPIIIDASLTNGTGLFNPSVFNDNGKIYVNVRHCQYTLYHSEMNIHEHPYGPLIYFNPENDITLTTTNYFARLDDNLDIRWVQKVDTSKLDIKPVWEFVGLEDCRIVKWNDNMYLSGVRRDTKPNGEGRMELSQIDLGNSLKEVSRFRIPAPGDDTSYCEKNWMPILDQPFHYLKWCNPVEVVKVDPVYRTCKTVFLGTEMNFEADQRGGGQVIPFEDGYLTITHETHLYWSEAGKKDATYRHRFVQWTKDWKVVRKSNPFSFMNAKIEFACGLALYGDNDLLVTFGYQDNAAYLLKCPISVVKEFMNA